MSILFTSIFNAISENMQLHCYFVYPKTALQTLLEKGTHAYAHQQGELFLLAPTVI